MIKNILLIVLVAVLAFAVGGVISVLIMPEAPTETAADSRGYVLDTPRELPPFEMVDQDGEPFTVEQFKGDWSLLYFGFTYCPDICPAALAEMARVEKILAESHPADSDRYYLVSVDPARDTPERLREYVAWFNPDFRGLTGEVAHIDSLALAAGAVYKVPENPENDEYLVSHSSTITLINPKGQIQAIFTSPLVAESVANLVGEVMANWQDE